MAYVVVRITQLFVQRQPLKVVLVNLAKLCNVINFVSRLIMVAVCNRADHYIFCLVISMFFLLSFFLSSPNLSGRGLDVYNTSTHGVTLVRI